ncbi:hypothetical protein J1605_019770 [Eschrichtius robustus]|uniref:Uncharacterized protein n=1 Tax=Eschrichtius robustus TaxID=9764 RepID=A0AB34HIA8_ESCRO|nr:hypothetical protein J1605_019770 [Eschrichtius robustus]
MHLLFLVAFSWVLAEGLPLCSKVMAVSMHPGPRKPLCYSTGWGEAPLLPTLALFPSTLPRVASVVSDTHRPAPSSTGTQRHPVASACV